VLLCEDDSVHLNVKTLVVFNLLAKRKVRVAGMLGLWQELVNKES
jgi:hypothetical protein